MQKKQSSVNNRRPLAGVGSLYCSPILMHVVIIVLCCLTLPVPVFADPPASEQVGIVVNPPHVDKTLTKPWRNDPVWHDGLAELATYEATRTIYGQPRTYTARFFVNKEHVDPATGTKSAAADPGAAGHIAAFKFHQRHDIPTKRYRYHYSMMSYVHVDSLQPIKVDMGSQEDCGASFKQAILRPAGWYVQQYSYFPSQGQRDDQLRQPAGAAGSPIVPFDALPVVLRGYPFDQPATLTISTLPTLIGTKWSPVRSEQWQVAYKGLSTLDLPYGQVDAHKLEVTFAGPTREVQPTVVMYFASDADLRHVLVQWDDGVGGTGRLATLKRGAYWR